MIQIVLVFTNHVNQIFVVLPPTQIAKDGAIAVLRREGLEADVR